MAEKIPKKKGRPPLPEHLKKKKPPSKYVKGVPRDFMWHYTDPKQHEMHLPFLRARAQANFRNEPWTLTIEEWFAVWGPHWHTRGRSRHSTCITRRDPAGAWSLDNVEIITRLEQIARAAEASVEQRRETGRFKVSERTIKKYTEPRTRGQRGPDRKPRRRKVIANENQI